MSADLDRLRFPIGEVVKPEKIDDTLIIKWIEEIANFPARLKKEVESLSEEQLNEIYRPQGWTLRQVVHHCADSHMNSFIRFKLALTEDHPSIKPYFEDRWAMLSDSMVVIAPSLELLEGLHHRWVVLLRSFSKTHYARTFFHPEHQKEIRLDEMIGFYAWHGNHHLAHIALIKKRLK